jgi:hypothetical protein
MDQTSEVRSSFGPLTELRLTAVLSPETVNWFRSASNGCDCEALVNWLPGLRAKSIPIAAPRPWENEYIESFHSRLRDFGSMSRFPILMSAVPGWRN